MVSPTLMLSMVNFAGETSVVREQFLGPGVTPLERRNVNTSDMSWVKNTLQAERQITTF